MRKLIGMKPAAFASVFLLSAVTVFHLLILTGLIPYRIVWGGRLGSDSEMYIFESVSIFINLLIIMIIFGRIGQLGGIFPPISRIGIWIVFCLFVLNTIGNILAVEDLEKFIFTPVTFLLALLTFRLAIGDRSMKPRG